MPNVVPGRKFRFVLKLIQVSYMKAHANTQCGPIFLIVLLTFQNNTGGLLPNNVLGKVAVIV